MRPQLLHHPYRRGDGREKDVRRTRNVFWYVSRHKSWDSKCSWRMLIFSPEWICLVWGCAFLWEGPWEMLTPSKTWFQGKVRAIRARLPEVHGQGIKGCEISIIQIKFTSSDIRLKNIEKYRLVYSLSSMSGISPAATSDKNSIASWGAFSIRADDTQVAIDRWKAD